jgi:hypothetical protein
VKKGWRVAEVTPDSNLYSSRAHDIINFFCIFFLTGYSVLATPLLSHPFFIFERCLDSNPES